MNIYLIIYLCQILVTVPLGAFMGYKFNIEDGKRQALVFSIFLGLLSFIPVVPVIVLTIALIGITINAIGEWMDREPSRPCNIKEDTDILDPEEEWEEEVLPVRKIITLKEEVPVEEIPAEEVTRNDLLDLED